MGLKHLFRDDTASELLADLRAATGEMSRAHQMEIIRLQEIHSREIERLQAVITAKDQQINQLLAHLGVELEAGAPPAPTPEAPTANLQPSTFVTMPGARILERSQSQYAEQKANYERFLQEFRKHQEEQAREKAAGNGHSHQPE